MVILITSAACCYPGLAAFDEQAKKVVEQAVRETGLDAEVKIVPAATALYGGALPKPVVSDLMRRLRRNETGPAVIINGAVVAFGVPKLEDIKATLEEIKTKNR